MKNKKTFFYLFTGLIVIVVLREIFQINTSDTEFFSLLTVWFLLIYFGRFLKELSLILGLFFLILSFLLTGLGDHYFNEKSAVWAYLFFLVGVVNIFVNDLQNDKKK